MPPPRGAGRIALAYAISFFALSFLVRFPYFFKAVYDWDESTFILLAQTLLEGDLPYLDLWDNKPPLLFSTYAAFIAAFGPSVAAVRAGGAAMVALTALFCGLLARRLAPSALPSDAQSWVPTGAGWMAGVACVVLLTVGAGGRSTMSEIVAVPFLMGAVALAVYRPHSLGAWLGVGALLAAACLVRLNLVLVAAVVVGGLAGWEGRVRAAALLAGAAISVGLVVFPYVAAGELELLFRSVVLAPLGYAAVGLSRWATGTTLAASSWRRRSPGPSAWFLGTGLATFASIYLTGRPWSHYYLQIHPFLAVLVGVTLSASLSGILPLPFRSPLTVPVSGRRLVGGALIAAGLLGASQLMRGYADLFLALKARAPLAAQDLDLGWTYGDAADVARYLHRANPARLPVYITRGHLAYWFLKQRPLTRMTAHPSNICREELLKVIEGPDATTMAELERILSIQPQFVVVEPGLGFFYKHPPAQARLAAELGLHYREVASFEKVVIYERVSGHSRRSASTGSMLAALRAGR